MVAKQEVETSKEEAESPLVLGDVIRIIETYDVFGFDVDGMIAMVLKPTSSMDPLRHMVYVPEIDDYCEPKESMIERLIGETMTHPHGRVAVMGNFADQE